MASFPVYTVDDLAFFANEIPEYFTEFGEEALDQAEFLVQERTETYQYPTTVRLQKAFKLAILDVAFQLYLESYFLKYKNMPFQSEVIGSYSYSKGQTANSALMSSYPTGFRWLDILLWLLGRDASKGLPSSGGVHVFDREGVVSVNGEDWELGPRDLPEYILDRMNRGKYLDAVYPNIFPTIRRTDP